MLDIEWDKIIIESILLAAMIFGAIYVEQWYQRRLQTQENMKTQKQIFTFIVNDLKRKSRFIDDAIKYKDYKPIFTDIWDGVILSGKQSLVPFDIFENLQHTFSWIKYYNTELEQKRNDDVIIKDLFKEIKDSINQSLTILEQTKKS